MELAADDYIRLVEDLAQAQGAAVTPFPVPDEVSRQDIAEIRSAVALISGEVTHITTDSFEGTFIIPDPEPFLGPMIYGEAMALAMIASYSRHIAGSEIHLGSAQYYLPAVRLNNL